MLNKCKLPISVNGIWERCHMRLCTCKVQVRLRNLVRSTNPSHFRCKDIQGTKLRVPAKSLGWSWWHPNLPAIDLTSSTLVSYKSRSTMKFPLFLNGLQAILSSTPAPSSNNAVTRGTPMTCPIDGPPSCSSSSNVFKSSLEESCCMNAPGGQFALTQFWNTFKYGGPPGYRGPQDSWTIHGLW